MRNTKEIKFAFFGTPDFAVTVLETLKKRGFTPMMVVTTPDKPKGRKLIVTPPPVKVWAEENNIPVLQPEKLKDEGFIQNLKSFNCELFVVASYGKIIPRKVLEVPEKGALNIHPSLLPKLRGPSPIETAILQEDETGVSIMIVDEEMDHGPVLVQRRLTFTFWPPRKDVLEKAAATVGAELLADVIPDYVLGKKRGESQEESDATYTKKMEKADGEIKLDGNPEENFRKFQAYYGWPGTYLFTKDKKRVIIKDAELKDGKFIIKRVLPEGGKEIDFISTSLL